MRAPFALGTVLLAFTVPLAVSIPSADASGTPCWRSVIADWSPDRTVNGRYPVSCLRQAMVNAPADLKIYSTLEDDLQSALRARSVRRLTGVHAAATLAAPTGSSSRSPLIFVLGGLAVFVAACTGAAILHRRRAAR
jgi:hypothetical protein